LGPKERREREREEIRGAILDAARELFAAEGYEAVTMRRIAERIEYSPTAIYFHFKDKEALLKELCAHDFLSLAQQFVAIDRIDDPIERLRRVGHAYIKFGLDHPNHYRLMFMTPHPPVDDESVEKGDPEEDAYAFLKAIISDAHAQKRLRPELKDIELICQTVWAAVHGAISLDIAKRNDPWVEWRPLKKRADAMVEMIISAVAKESGR
jgi:AcrR family transcriptional regulator